LRIGIRVEIYWKKKEENFKRAGKRIQRKTNKRNVRTIKIILFLYTLIKLVNFVILIIRSLVALSTFYKFK